MERRKGASVRRMFAQVPVYFLIMLCVLLFARTTHAEEAQAPQVVKVGLYVLNISKLDPTDGSFDVDMYLGFKSDQPVPETYEFLNGRAISTIKILDEPNMKYYRILAKLSTPLDYHRFPFDKQVLKIKLEDNRHTVEEVVYQVDNDTALDEMVVLPGWNIDSFGATVDLHEYRVYDEVYSRYTFQVNVSKIWRNSFIKAFLPVFFMMLITLSSFILNPEQIVTRLATISSMLVATVMFHLSLTNQIPPVPYLTFSDKFMLMTYLSLLVGFFLNISVFVLQNKGKKDAAKTLARACEYIMFIGVPAGYASLFFFWM